MTVATAPSPARSLRSRRFAVPAPALLLWLELRRNVMPWMLPVLAVLFWLTTYRPAMSNPPLWNVRGSMLQAQTMLGFAPLLAGVAAWSGSREGRRGITDLVGISGLPRWAGRFAAWAAVTLWAEAAYLAGVAVVYGITAHQAVWGGPLWWPVAVGAATAAAACAVGFAAGTLLPSRFTAPLVAVVVFLALGGGAFALQHGARATYSQIWPLNVQGAFPTDSFGIFYHELPDLPIAQIMFVGGLGVAALGALGLPPVSGGRMLRAAAAALTIAGLAAAGTAVGLAGTAKLGTHGIVIPALHDAASDRPVSYTPVCASAGVQVCVQPAYRPYLPEITAALAPLLKELAGLPGAPTKVTQVAATRVQQAPGNGIGFGPPAISGRPAVLYLPLSGISLPGEGASAAWFTSALRNNLVTVLNAFVGLAGPQTRPGSGVGGGLNIGSSPPRTGRNPGQPGPGAPAQLAVATALAQDAGLLTQLGLPLAGQPGSTASGSLHASVQAVAKRFAALPAAARHTWLLTHLSALRAGQITNSRVP
jgi:hypothetical protein